MSEDKSENRIPRAIGMKSEGSDSGKPEYEAEKSEDKISKSEGLEATEPDEHFPEDKSAQAKPQTLNLKPQTESMEVHHHGHVHHQKKWKEYLFQFFMLFLAVFCGFLAEYQLEHTIEHQREIKYVRSLIEDLKSDRININAVTTFNLEKIKGLDSLTNLIRSSKITRAEAKRMYDLKFAYTGRFRRAETLS